MSPTSPWGKQNIDDTQIKEKGFASEEKIGTPVPKKAIAPDIDTLTEEQAYALNKAEQIELLKLHGVSDTEIKSLKLEKDRVNKILEAQ